MIAVVDKLPKGNIRNVETREGEKYELITIEEALTEILEEIRNNPEK